MLKLDMLRLFVDQRLSALTDDIFWRFAKTIAEYEGEIFLLKQEIDRQRGLLETAGRPEDRPAGVLQIFTTEEEQQVRGQSFRLHIRQEEGGASGPEGTNTEFTHWLRERPETDQSPSSNQIQSCRDEAGPHPAVSKQEVLSVKQEVGEGDTTMEAAVRAEISSQQEGVLQSFTTEEEQQVRGRSFCLHIKQEEGGASGPEGTDIELTQSPDWLRERPETDQSPSSNQIQSCRDEAGPRPAVSKQKVPSVKQEVGEGDTTMEAAVRAEISSQQEGVLQIFTTEEEQQVRGRSFCLHIKQEEGGPSGPEGTNTKFTHSPDWLMESYEDEGSSSSSQIQSLRESDPLISPEPGGNCITTDHNRDSVIQSESCAEDSDDAQVEPGLQNTWGTGSQPLVDQKLLVCGSCGREFSSVRTLRKHIRRNTPQDQHQMSCSLRRHKAPFQSPAKSFSCRICRSSFYTQGILVRHAMNHCKEPESRCGACGDCLESTEILRDHLQSHKELGSTCDVCGKKCSSIKRMEIHKRVHTGEKPYSCGFCTRKFSRKESLDRHLKIHSGDRPHCCGHCRKTFTRREYLVQHLKTNHTERPGPPPGAEPFSMTL